MPDKALFTELVYKYLNDTLSEEEKHTLARLLDHYKDDPEFDTILWETYQLGAKERLWNDSIREDFVGRVMEKTVHVQPRVQPVYRTFWFRAAAAILLAVSLITYFSLTTSVMPGEQVTQVAAVSNTILPGGDRAMLTLSDGSVISLDSAANGNLAQQGSMQIIKGSDGKIIYQGAGSANLEELWNTMRTPKGGQYQLSLSDGTKVWLNAASSIRFPVQFGTTLREVQITGEVYFEVVKQQHAPFVVKLPNGSNIEVLGTRFNINAYDDESAIKTALAEGSVRIQLGNAGTMLTPGNQAIIDNGTVHTSPVNLDQVLAWKTGVFDFNGADLKTVMRQLERWYDIEVRYERTDNDLVFEGKMYRNVQLSDVLEVLQKMGVKFELNNRLLTIK